MPSLWGLKPLYAYQAMTQYIIRLSGWKDNKNKKNIGDIHSVERRSVTKCSKNLGFLTSFPQLQVGPTGEVATLQVGESNDFSMT